jgi:type II secretory pathway component PulF
MLRTLTKSVESVAQSVTDVANARARALTNLGETALMATVALIVLLIIAVLLVVSPAAGVGFAVIAGGGYWLLSR